MRAFITGGAGFIGSHLADALIVRGDSVTILDNMSTGSAKNIAHLQGKIDVHEGDIRNKELVEALVDQSDIVFHLAAALGVKNIMEHTLESIDRNFNGSEIVLHTATKYKKRLIIASTSEIYGKNPNQPLNEESDRVVGAPQKIRWTYADAKALEEAVAHSLFLTEVSRSQQLDSLTLSVLVKQVATEWLFHALSNQHLRMNQSQSTAMEHNPESSAMSLMQSMQSSR